MDTGALTSTLQDNCGGPAARKNTNQAKNRKEKRPDPGERGAASLNVKSVNQAKSRKDKWEDPGKRGASQSESGQ